MNHQTRHDEIRTLQRVDRMGRTEFLSGLLFTGAVALTAWAFLGFVAPVLWWLVHFSLAWSARSLIARGGRGDLAARLRLAGAINACIAILLAVFVCYLWLQPEPILKTAAIVLLIGAVINVVSGAYRTRGSTHFDAVSIVATICFLGFTAARPVAVSVEHMLIAGMTVALAVYFLIGVRDVQLTRSVLQSVETDHVQAHKAEAVARLTGGVAHDFNNLLTVIAGNLDLYGEARSQAEQDAAMAEVRRAADRGTVLISHLLSFSRQAPMTVETLSLAEYLPEIRIVTARLLPPEIEFRIEVREDTRAVRADRAYLGRALLNLIINARDAMPLGGLLLLEAANLRRANRPGFATALPDGNFVRIDIWDEGRGIARDDLSRVADPFFTTKGVGQGSGLGLPMVKGFAEQSGGAFEIDSRQGGGTHVTLILPAA